MRHVTDPTDWLYETKKERKRMRFINGKLHGMLDYATAVALIVAPFLLDLSGAPAFATWFSVAAGVGLFGYSLLTDYSLGVRNTIPFRVHLVFDFVAGAAFTLAPFVLGFPGTARGYYLVMGVAVILVVLFTDPNADEAAGPGRAQLEPAR